ncbi:hypothetical protein [Ferrovum myxofaciens]|uniref:hypothetical protein n=1 Tax=Ferrovum myxofaciens TaxID=416213 RepID=UPI0004E13A83|nr:hypothetical protein [Ferrovum myxofaciens]
MTSNFKLLLLAQFQVADDMQKNYPGKYNAAGLPLTLMTPKKTSLPETNLPDRAKYLIII